MGNERDTQQTTMRPTSLLVTDPINTNDHILSKRKYYDGDQFNMTDYFRHKKSIQRADLLATEKILLSSLPSTDEALAPVEKKSRQKRMILAKRTEDGKLEAITPQESLWYMLYVDAPQIIDDRFLHKFRRRFRLPYNSYLGFVEEATEKNWFPHWSPNKERKGGKPPSPLELLILGSLRYLGRGFTLDDCEECTAISEEVHRVFFHKFIKIGETILFPKYVITPSSARDAVNHLVEYAMAGMPGCIASVDGTHIVHEKCSYRLNRLHKGGKTKLTTRSFNLGANHRRQIICSTTGHPGSWNDKTLALFDPFLRDIKQGKTLQDNEFELLEEANNGDIVKVKYRGVWVVVDNGYLSWAITIPQFNHTQSRKEIRWSEWIESMRKDIECTFGILKGRWRILKSGIRLHSTKSVDRIWLTCCALHNMLLEVDGLDQPWNGVNAPSSDWDRDLGELDYDDIPAAFHRLVSCSC